MIGQWCAQLTALERGPGRPDAAGTHPPVRAVSPRRPAPTRRPRVGQRGAAAVEMALVMLMLVTLLLGICEFAYAFFTQGTLAGAAREAARNYALHHDTASADAAAVNAAQSIGLTDSDIAIPANACSTASGPDDAVTVTITYDYTGITGFFGHSFTLTADGTMRCNG